MNIYMLLIPKFVDRTSDLFYDIMIMVSKGGLLQLCVALKNF